MRRTMSPGGKGRLAATALAVLLSGAGCGLDKADEPALVGPSETGVSVQFDRAPRHPERGWSERLGGPASSCGTNTGAADERHGGELLPRVRRRHPVPPSASSTYVGPIQTGFVMATDTNGVAYVVYVAGTGIGTVRVAVRPLRDRHEPLRSTEPSRSVQQ